MSERVSECRSVGRRGLRGWMVGSAWRVCFWGWCLLALQSICGMGGYVV